MRKLRVLVADDSPFFVKVVADHMHEEGHRVWTAANGEEASRICRRVRPDVVVADELMPYLTGIEVCSLARPPLSEEDGPWTFVVTASPEANDHFHATDFGVDLYMSKRDFIRLMDSRAFQNERLPHDIRRRLVSEQEPRWLAGAVPDEAGNRHVARFKPLPVIALAS
ncbi:MAG: response regulator [Deltaproteobacteria bacterium]|nr:response regulator [Deltaproteobacteria bacterium]